MLATLDEGGCHRSDWSQLDEKLRQANARDIRAGAALSVEHTRGGSQKTGIALNIPVDRLPAHMLLKHMYSQGEVSVEDIDLYQEFMNKRNRIADGAKGPVDSVFMGTLMQKLPNLFAEWREEQTR